MAGADGSVLPYREVLRPRPWVWLMPLGFAASLGAAYGYAYGAGAGWLVAASTSAVLTAAMALGMRTPIEVGPAEVRAGHARLPARYIGRVRPLDAAQTFRARTADADPRAHLVLRSWSGARSVIFEITDPADPHPYWLVSTRQPDRLADALLAARAAAETG